MSKPEATQICPDCDAAIVARVHGPWCPRCRAYLTLQRVLQTNPISGSLEPVYVWAIAGRRF